MDGDMVDPPRDERPEGAAPEGATPVPDDPALGDDVPERASEIDDVTDSMRRPLDGDAGVDDAFDDIVGEIDYSDVDVPALLAEREEYKGLAQRVQADFDNYRKRAAAQSLAEADRASGRLAEALLPVLDAAEAAYVRHPDEIGPLLNQMLGELKKHGLEALDLENKPFDPEYAEAVAHEPGDGGEPTVSEVLRSGYTWKGKVLRAAMVKTKH
jgi:molecular chaperone GrpE